jgi:hypothetical protein
MPRKWTQESVPFSCRRKIFKKDLTNYMKMDSSFLYSKTVQNLLLCFQ